MELELQKQVEQLQQQYYAELDWMSFLENTLHKLISSSEVHFNHCRQS